MGGKGKITMISNKQGITGGLYESLLRKLAVKMGETRQ